MKNTLYALNALVTKGNPANRKLVLEFALPYSNNGETCETIIVPASYIGEKMKYLKENYNFDLTLKRNPQVKINKFYLQ